jgi:hypothetical protein
MHMQARTRSLLALAIAAALLPGLALADKPTVTGQAKGHVSSVSRIPVTSDSYRGASSTKARTDVPAKAADTPQVDEDMDDDDDDADDVGGTDTNASTKSAAQTNPGQGNWWADTDTDDDGRISRAEATGNAGLDSRFATVDTDGDGFVTQEEYRTYYTANASQGEQHADDGSAVVTRDIWTRFDADSDGKLSPIEVDLDARLKADFGSIDADGDGFVTDAEYRMFYRGQ